MQTFVPTEVHTRETGLYIFHFECVLWKCRNVSKRGSFYDTQYKPHSHEVYLKLPPYLTYIYKSEK